MSEQINPVDWSNPAAVEAMLSSEGLGDIDQDITPMSDTAVVEFYATASRASDLAIPTVRSTLERYAADPIGGAIAVHVTSVLAAELPADGRIDATEEGVIDDVTAVIQTRGLIGITLEDLTRAGNINPELGGLLALMEVRDMIESTPEDSDLLTELRERAGTQMTAAMSEEDEASYWENDTDYNDYPEEDESDDDSSDALVDDSGEAFEL